MNLRTIPVPVLLVVVALAFILNGCASSSSDNSGQAGSADPGSGDATGGIEGVEWDVASSSEQDFSAFGMTATFEDGVVSGKGAVNSYSAPCVVGSDGTLEIGEITSTLMAGSDEANAAESAYFALLKTMVEWELRGQELVLTDGAQSELVLTRE